MPSPSFVSRYINNIYPINIKYALHTFFWSKSLHVKEINGEAERKKKGQ